MHEAFQRQGSKLRNTVRVINNVNGSEAIFQKVGKGTASTKSTYGMVPVMNLDHSAVTATLQAKRWLGTLWIPHSGLPIDGSDIRSCFWYHKSAVGHAAAADVTTDITWHGDRAAHFVNNMMSQGSVLIDAAGIVEIKCDETPD